MPEKREKKIAESIKLKQPKGLYRKFLIIFNFSIILSTIILLAGLIITGYQIYGEEFIVRQIGIMESILKFLPVLIVFAIALIAISTFNVFWFRKQVVNPLSMMEQAIEAIKAGNFEKRIRLKTGDEFEKIAETFNQMMDRLSTLIQTEEEKKEIQANIIKFLQIMTSASEGDLSKRAEVTPDVFGSMADAFNLMADGLSELVKEVKNSADDIGQKSAVVNEIIQKLQKGVEIEKQEMEKVISLIEEASNIATQTSEKTKIATDVSKEALDAITKGNEIVTETINSMQLIRTAVQGINRRMKLLGEKLMEISTISTLISDIANRTNLLALNASIEAARAGESGRGFVVIAEEIRTLSEKTAKSSHSIADIIAGIQEEATAVTRNLEEETNYVEIGTNMVSKTTDIFETIDSIIKKIGQIIIEINESAIKQKEITDYEVGSIRDVKSVIEITTRITDELTNISKSLEETSKILIESSERFKV